MADKLYSAGEMMTALIVWEDMLATNTKDFKSGGDSPLTLAWEKQGAYEMRDHATAIAVWIEGLFGDSAPGDMSHPLRALCDAYAFDWEIVPAILDLIVWDGPRWEPPANLIEQLQARLGGLRDQCDPHPNGP